MKSYSMLIDGKWTESAGGNVREIRDPGNGELLAKVPEADRRDVKSAVLAARRAFDTGPWRTMSAQDRATKLFQVAHQKQNLALNLHYHQ